jgi:hypothetical protein
MKGDFTRFTFQPNKQYTSVLMQQGRLQLDADWNEQMGILAYLNQVQARDTIGASAGTSETEGGFEIQIADEDNTDLIITPGRFYLDGILCELVRGSNLDVELLADSQLKKIRVPNWLVDDLEFDKNQWVEISQQVPTDGQQNLRYQIESIDVKLQILTLAKPLPQNWQDDKLILHRVTTYATQPNYPKPPKYPHPSATKKDILVYLDAWQRHITAIEDPSIREVALQVPDTATRTKTVWQVKLLPIDLSGIDKKNKITLEQIKALKEWQQLTGEYPGKQKTTGRIVKLTASTDLNPDAEVPTPGYYQGTDNRLYRIEIHTSGSLGTATFKWSRDNGSTVSAIDRIEGNIINLISPIKDIHNLFSNEPGKPLPWLEITNEEQELKNEPGTLVQLIDAKPDRLIFDLSKIRGNIPTATKDEARVGKFKVRRWHDTSSGEILTSKDGWISIEDGISIEFTVGTFTDPTTKNQIPYEFQTGDFWLIPARESTKSIEWTQDDLGRWQPQPPQGIDHHYTPLASIDPDESSNPKIVDFRTKFPTLVNCFDKKLGDSIEGSLGIGFNGTPPATLYVRGNKQKQPDGTETNRTIVKIDRNDGQTQFVINAEGNIGIGTEPFAFTETNNKKLSIEGNTQLNGQISVTNLATFGSGITLDNLTNNIISSVNNLSLIATGNLTLQGTKINLNGDFQFDKAQFNSVGIGIVPPSDIKLHVNGIAKIGDASNYVTLEPPSLNEPAKFTTTTPKGYQFDNKITILNGGIALNDPTESTISSRQKLSLKAAGAANITIENNNIKLNGILQGDKSKFNNIGIGVNAPADEIKLQVDGNLKISDDDNFITIEPPNSIDRLVKFTTNASVENYQFDKGIKIGSGNITFGTPTSGSLGIGIEASEPTARLHIKTNNNSDIIRFTDQAGAQLLAIKKDPLKQYISFDGKINMEDELQVKGITVTSSHTLKENITDLSNPEVRQILQGLNPVKFTYKSDQNQILHFGFIAEDVPNAIASEDRQSIDLINIIAALTKVVKEHQGEISTLIKVLRQQKGEIDNLKNKVQSLENR